MNSDLTPPRVVPRRTVLKYAALGLAAASSASLLACSSQSTSAPAPTAAAPAATSAPAAAPAAPAGASASPAAGAAAAPAAAAPATASAAAAQQAPAKTGSLLKMKAVLVGPVLNPANSNYWISQYLGYNQEEGLDVEWQPSQGIEQALPWLISGQIDVTLPTADSILPRSAKGEDPPIMGFYLSNRQNGYGIGVMPDSPIKEVKDLKGKNIGVVSLGSGPYLLARGLIKEAGMDPDKDVQYTTVGQDAPAGAALRGGQVDALANTTISFINIRNIGIQVRELPPTPLQNAIFGNFLAVRRDFIDKNRQAVVGFGRALAKGTTFFLENPGMALRIHWKMFPESIPKGMPEDQAFTTTLKTFDARIPVYQKKPDQKWGQFNAEDWKTYVKYLGLEGQVDDKKFWTNDLIAEINNFDEAKIRDQAKNYKLS